MTSYRLTAVKNTMRIYVHSFRLCQPLVSSSIPQICLLFVIYLKFLITLVKGMFDLQIDKKNKKQNDGIK